MKSKAIFSLLLVVSFPLFLSAQLNHFLYLQTEGKQPFYAKIDKKILSSSVSGYLIIPKLKDGSIDVTIGFPKGEIEEQTFSCTITNDAGYLIKKFGDKGWGLFNMQTLDVVMANSSSTDVAKTIGKEKTDAFSSMLSEVVNDPSIKQQEKSEPEVKPGVKPAIEVKETPVSNIQEEKPEAVRESSRSVIIKNKVVTASGGLEAVYIDITGDKQDTITILIPADQEITVAGSMPVQQEVQKNNDNISKPAKEIIQPQQPVPAEAPQIDEKTGETEIKHNTGHHTKEEPADDKKFLPIEIKTVVKPDSISEKNHMSPMVNSDCKAYATEEDFLKLRKKMAAEDTDDGMIKAAQKFLKSKCYTVEQVKNLAVLFLKDEGKYKFFDVAYAFVADSHNFHTLENQLADPYFITRFKAMVRH